MKIKQSKGWMWFGALKNVYGEAAMYMQVIQFVVVLIIGYTTTLAPALYTRGIFVPTWALILMFIAIVVVVMLFAWVVGLPSHYKFMGNQLGTYGDFTDKNMKTILKRLEDIEGKIK